MRLLRETAGVFLPSQANSQADFGGYSRSAKMRQQRRLQLDRVRATFEGVRMAVQPPQRRPAASYQEAVQENVS